MPYRLRPPTLLNCFFEIVMTPFIFILTGVVLSSGYLLIALISLLICVALGADITVSVWPTSRELFIVLGVLTTIWAIAVALTIFDYAFRRNWRTEFYPDAECVHAACSYAQAMLDSDVTTVYSHFIDKLRRQISLEEFHTYLNQCPLPEKSAASIVYATEQVKAPQEDFDDSGTFDTVIHIGLEDDLGTNSIVLVFFLDSRRNNRIADLSIECSMQRKATSNWEPVWLLSEYSCKTKQ